MGCECFAIHKIFNPCIAGSVKGTWERGFYCEVRGNWMFLGVKKTTEKNQCPICFETSIMWFNIFYMAFACT